VSCAKNGWTDQDTVYDVDTGRSKEACTRWECKLVPPGEYDWTVHVRRRYGLFVKLLWPFVIMYSWVVWSVSVSVCRSSDPCKNGWTHRDAAWVEDSGRPKEPCIRWGFRSPTGMGNFKGEKGQPIVKYSDFLRSVQKQLNRSRCCLVFRLGWAQEIMY